MKKRAQEIFDVESRKVILAQNKEEAQASMEKLIMLATILDEMGERADADKVDVFIKEAGGWLDAIMGLVGGAATSKDEQTGEYFGPEVIQAIRSGDFSKLLNKETLIPVITRAIATAGVGVLTGEIIDALTKKVPGFTLIKDSTFTKMAISGALTYAITKSDFVSKLLDGLITQIKKAFGVAVKEEAPKQQQQQPQLQQPAPQQYLANNESKKPEQGTSTQQFQMALPGAKQ